MKRALFILGAATMLAAYGSGIGSAQTAATRSFNCTQTTPSRAAYRQAVQGTLDSSNVPHNVVVTRPSTGAVEISSANPTFTPGYDGGYWKSTYHLNTWKLGSVNTGSPPKTLYLLLPDSTIGATFTALLKTDFLNAGNWQHWMSCTTA
jgi:hypothetical protein